MATSDSFPENPDWAILLVEASEIQQRYAKEAEFSRRYFSYVDSEPAFLFSHEKIEIPMTVNAIDRVFIKGKMNHIKKGRLLNKQQYTVISVLNFGKC